MHTKGKGVISLKILRTSLMYGPLVGRRITLARCGEKLVIQERVRVIDWSSGLWSVFRVTMLMDNFQAKVYSSVPTKAEILPSADDDPTVKQ